MSACTSTSASTSVSHSCNIGLPLNGRHSTRTWEPSPSLRLRSSQLARVSSETTTAFPAVTRSPANSPPLAMRPSRCAINVVLPDFHWLVSKVTLPAAR